MTRESGSASLRADDAAPAQSALSLDAQRALAERVRAACTEWISQMSVIQRHEAEFGLRLARCRTSSEAAGVCGEWLGHRLDSAVVMHHRFLELWLTFTTAAPNGAGEATQPGTASKTGPST